MRSVREKPPIVRVAGLYLVLAVSAVFAIPQPGDVFREYVYPFNNSTGYPEMYLRVGGQLETNGGNATLGGDWDLDGATKAEVVAEKELCHDGTYGLAVSLNGHDFHEFPESDSIPSPQKMYQHWFFPEVSVDVSELKATGNTAKFAVAPDNWWPQNLIYGAIVRIYYSDSKPHPTGRVIWPHTNAELQWKAKILAEAGGTVDRVEFIGKYMDYNYPGDGIFRQWQYRWEWEKLTHILGTAKESPYEIQWDNSWVPDQPGPMQIAARIVGADGIIYETTAAGGLTFNRGDFKVEMGRPYDQQQKWVTRDGEKSEHFDIAGELSTATAAKVLFCVWSYESPISFSVNGTNVGPVDFEIESPTILEAELPTSALQAGQNTLTVPGGGHHGHEIEWPGPVPFVQYGAKPDLVEEVVVGVREEGACRAPAAAAALRYDAQRRTLIVEAGAGGAGRPASMPITSAPPSTVTLVGVDGKVVRSECLRGKTGHRVDLNGLGAGVYLVRCVSGQRVLTGSIAISK